MGQRWFGARFASGFFLFSVFLNSAIAEPLADAKGRCASPSASETFLYNEDFKWNVNREEMLERDNKIYHSGKRLKHRAYFDSAEQNFYLPYKGPGDLKRLRVSERFIRSVILHVEEALRLNYVEVINFADMGHSHFFVPDQTFKAEVVPHLELNQIGKAYEKMFELADLKILYHTGEQLKMREDGIAGPTEYHRWRYYTRNLIGDNRAEGRLEIHAKLHEGFNTVNDAKGHTYWSGGFNISASQNGCFSFKHNGEVKYFDISLYDIEPESGVVGSY